MNTMISMNIIRRAGVFIAAAAVVPFAALAASGCGGATTTAGGATSGLENKTPTQILHDAAAALGAAKSVQIVFTPPRGKRRPSQVDLRIQGDSRTLTLVQNGIGKAEFTIIGQHAYVKITPAMFKILPPPPSLKRIVGRWLRIPAKRLTLRGFSLASLQAVLTHHGPLEPLRRTTFYGRKVVVVTDQRNGAKLYVANTGPAYPLLVVYPDGRRIELSDYGANFHITAPSNAILAH
jgi:hypothetical protein